MKHALAIVLLLAASATCRAELRSMVVTVTRDTNSVTTASIYSDVDGEKRGDISISEATEVLRDAKGWGSTVWLVIVLNNASLRECKPMLDAINDNAWLDLIAVRNPKCDANVEQILKHYGVEQAGPGYPPQGVGSPDP